MGKAILVMDMPSSCTNCPCAGNNYGYNECEPKGKRLALEDIYEKKPSWCPLKAVPEKPDYPPINESSFVAGYNACIDEILKGSEV